MVGPYEILGRLGGGGMGLVFRAWDERLHREVAIKLVRDGYQVPGTRERFLQEARAASGLNHPNICTIFDTGEQDGDPYLVMELLEGETLKERISRGALSAEEILLRSREVAEALSAAHAKGIVHRDIKPANIFLVKKQNGTSQAKVLDFGLAKVRKTKVGQGASVDAIERAERVHTLQAADEPSGLTLAGATVGTVAYMSPEQARGHVLDLRSDLFSLGVVMYEMATRRIPFRGTTSTKVFVQLLENDPEPVRNWNDSIPRELERAILKLLAKDRRERFQSARELNEELDKISGKLNRSVWLKRSAPAPVPLVRSLEPVAARQKRPVKRDSTPDATQIRNESGSGAGDVIIRPLRIPEDVRPVESAGKTVSQGSVLTASDPSGGRKPGSSGGRGTPALARSRSGVTQFEFGLDDLPPVEERHAEIASEPQAPPRRSVMRLMIASVLVTAIGMGAYALVRSGRLSSAALAPNDVLLLTVVQDKTGEALGGAVLEGLEIALRQSPTLNVRGDDTYRAGLHQLEGNSIASARVVAQRVGAKAYLFGEISGHAPYTISVDVLDAVSNDKLTSLTQQASTRQEIPAAIDSLVRSLRSELGEGARSIAETSVPLSREGTDDMSALESYSTAEAAMQAGRANDAIKAYMRAVGRDERFIQAQMRLAWLYQTQNAEVAAIAAAEHAQAASKGADEKVRLRAQFCYEMIAVGDYGRAATTIRHYTERFPRDVDGMVGLSRVLLAQGHLVEALLAAQQAYEVDPYRADAYAEAEKAMIGLDRFDSALQLETQAKQLGIAASGLRLAAGYLAGREDVVAEETRSFHNRLQTNRAEPPAAIASYGLYLDNSGRMDEAAWNNAVATTKAVPELASARAYLFAQRALDRALLEDCSKALTLVRASDALSGGNASRFRSGMAAALCGERANTERAITSLEQLRSGGTAVTRYGPLGLRAALAISEKDPGKALDLLSEIQPQDELSLVPYLRALAYGAQGDQEQAMINLRAVMEHRGTVFLAGSNLYPVARSRLLRATASSSGGLGNSKRRPKEGTRT